MGLNVIILRSFLALILLCVTVIGEKYHITERNVNQKDYSRLRRTEDAQLIDGSIDQSNRPKLTRPSRRFSRPHTLLIPTKSPMVKQAHNAGKDVDKDLTQTQLNASEIHSPLNEVDAPEPTNVSVEGQFGLAGGSEDSEAEKVSQPDVPQLHIDPTELQRNESHIQTNASNDIGIAHSNKTRRVRHKVRKTRPSVPSDLSSRLRSLVSSISDLSQHNGTLCNNICNTTACVEYVRPYLTYLHQLASDAYDAQSEKQSIVKVKVKEEPRIGKGLKWSIPKIVIRNSKLAVDQSTGATDAVEISGLQIREEFERKSTLQENSNRAVASLNQSVLEQNITILNNILVSKDATVKDLVQRLSILEQELSTLRHTPLTPTVAPPEASTIVSTKEVAVVEGEVSVTSDDGEPANQKPTETPEECDKNQSIIGDTATTVSTAGIDVAREADDVTIVIDTKELLQHVLNALYIVSASAASTASNDLSEITESALQKEETPFKPTETDTALESVHPVTTIKAHTDHPSIVDRVETAPISLRDAPPDKEEDSTHSDVIVLDREIISSNARTDDNPNPLLTAVETLENQVKALNDELTHVSAQLCHYRGQHFAPDSEEEHLTSESTKKFWFW